MVEHVNRGSSDTEIGRPGNGYISKVVKKLISSDKTGFGHSL